MHHICIWVLVHVNVCMCNCAHTCGGQRTMECVFLHLDILHFLRQSQSLNLELTDWQGWLANERQRFSCLCFPSTEITVTHWSFWRGCWGSEFRSSLLCDRSFMDNNLSNPCSPVRVTWADNLHEANTELLILLLFLSSAGIINTYYTQMCKRR